LKSYLIKLIFNKDQQHFNALTLAKIGYISITIHSFAPTSLIILSAMKNILLLITFPLMLLGSYDLRPTEKRALSDLKKNIVSCGASSPEDIDPAPNGKFIGPLPGWGHYSYPISTSSDSARYYFNQGLTMYYSYHMRESVASFKEAARFDPGCAMAYWGQALAMGPNYNAAYGYKMPGKVLAILELMNQNISHASPKEKQLVEVMGRRYSPDTADRQRTDLSMAYARGMRELIAQYPDDLDIRALYIDATMLMHAWDFWNNDGSAKEWTTELTTLCEELLKKSPDHPAALHYYIHLTEASRHPEAAFANAAALKRLFPGVAHMVHMSSHEYERTGLYAQGVEANDKADEALRHYDSLAKNLSLNKHSIHYFAVQTYCGLSGGMYQKGMSDAWRCRNSVAPAYEKTDDQYLYMIPVLTLVRLGKWEELLRDSIGPDARWPYARVLYHFGRGLAFVYTGHPDSAAGQLSQLRNDAKDPILTKRDIPFNTPLQGAGIAEGILNGAILFSQKKYDTAIGSLKQAIQTEDSLIYEEPRDWMIPARQFLGAYLLKLGRPSMAESVYREDLVWNPGNGWSSLGLYNSLRAQHKDKDLAACKAQYLRSFAQADRMPPGSVFME
jgi:tetratricopeptide (TPR) repeat protein